MNNLQRKYESKKDYVTGLYNDLGSNNINNLSSNLTSNFGSLTKLNEYLKRKELFSNFDNIDLGKYEDISKLSVLRDIKLLDNLDMPQIGDLSDSSLKSKYGNDYQRLLDLAELRQYLNGNSNDIDTRKFEDSLRSYNPEKYELWKSLKKYSKYSNLTSYGKDSASSLIGKRFNLTKLEKIVSGVREFELGKSYPSFSELTLQGISFSGLNFAYFYQPIYFAIIYGQVNDQYTYFGNFTTGIKRKLTGVKIGFGDKDFTHLHFSFFRSGDNAIKGASDSIIFYPQLLQNYVVSVELKIKYKERFCILSEYARSLLYSFYDTSSMVENTTFNWIDNISIRQKAQYSNSAFIIKGNFNLTETNTYLFASIKKISPNYNTLFVPFLKKDNLLFDFRIDQKLFKNKLTFSVFIKNNHDNLGNWKPITTTYTYIGLKLSFKYKQILTGSVSYSPIVQKNDAENPLLVINNKISNYSGNLTWYENLKKAKSIASFGFSTQQFKSISSLNDYFTLVMMVNEVLNFKKGLSLNFHFDYIIPNTQNDSSKNYSILLSASYNLGKKVFISAGAFTRLSQEITSLTSSIVLTYRINKYFDFSLRIEEQYLINEIIKSKTNNWLGSFGISMQL